MRYVALLRGVNVGGQNSVSMEALRASFERLRFRKVSTYIQSGNVLFESTRKPGSTEIEQAIAEEFRICTIVVVVSQKQLDEVIEQAPEGFGSEAFQCNVAFLKPPLKARTVEPTIPRKEGVDEVYCGDHALYFRKLKARASSSRLSKLIENEAYKSMTIRSWSTTTAIARLMAGAGR